MTSYIGSSMKQTRSACVWGDWKIVVKKGVPFLYNLATDIHEDNNVADQHPEIVEKMKTIIFCTAYT